MAELLVEKAGSFYTNKEYEEAEKAYRDIKRAYPDLAEIFDFNIALCQRKASSQTNVLAQPKPDVYVTLTTISERLPILETVIRSLHNQTLLPTKIYIYVSEDPYLLDKGVDRSDPMIGVLAAYPLVEIKWVRNSGPYRKIVPFMEDFYSSAQRRNKTFITVDDDTLYPDYFIRTLYDKHVEYDAVVAFRGKYIFLEDQAIAKYKKWGVGRKALSMSNLPTGKDGVIYSTKYFTKDFVDLDSAVDLAPTADDLWIKWHTGLNGVKSVILNPEAATSDYKSFPVVDYSDSYRDVSLYRAHNSCSSGGKNDYAVKDLEAAFLKKYGYNLYVMCSGE